MNNRTLIIECGVAATCAALIDNDEVIRFWFGPARGDEMLDSSPRAGRRFAGRVLSINRALNAAFVDVGDGRDAYLALKKNYEANVTEGVLIETIVKSPPRQSKGAVLKYIGAAPSGTDGPGRLAPMEDAALEAVHAIGADISQIIIDDGRAHAALNAASLDAKIHHEQHNLSLFEVHGAEAELAAAFDQVIPLLGGGRLIFDEAQALTAIDVDSAGLSAASPARLREKVAIAAAHEAVRQISLRNIGGHIVIDFPPISAKVARERFNAELKKATAKLDAVSAASFSKSALFSFTMPHAAQSLLDRFTETARNNPVAGRQFTLDWCAKAAIRTMEHRLRTAPKIRLQLTAGDELFSYLGNQQVWTKRLGERYGNRSTMTKDQSYKARHFDITEQ